MSWPPAVSSAGSSSVALHQRVLSDSIFVIRTMAVLTTSPPTLFPEPFYKELLGTGARNRDRGSGLRQLAPGPSQAFME